MERSHLGFEVGTFCYESTNQYTTMQLIKVIKNLKELSKVSKNVQVFSANKLQMSYENKIMYFKSLYSFVNTLKKLE